MAFCGGGGCIQLFIMIFNGIGKRMENQDSHLSCNRASLSLCKCVWVLRIEPTALLNKELPEDTYLREWLSRAKIGA